MSSVEMIVPGSELKPGDKLILGGVAYEISRIDPGPEVYGDQESRIVRYVDPMEPNDIVYADEIFTVERG